MKVKATKIGYDGWGLRQVGEIFEIKDSQFTDVWMEKVEVGEVVNDRKSEFMPVTPEVLEVKPSSPLVMPRRGRGRPPLLRKAI